MPKVDTLISKMHQEKARKVRNDWSDDAAEADGDSLIEQDMKSLVSDNKMGPSQNAL